MFYCRIMICFDCSTAICSFVATCIIFDIMLLFLPATCLLLALYNTIFSHCMTEDIKFNIKMAEFMRQ